MSDRPYLSYKQIHDFASNPEAQAYFHRVRVAPIVEFFNSRFPASEELPPYVQELLSLVDKEARLVEAVTSETFTQIVKYCSKNFWRGAPKGLNKVIIEQIVRNLTIKLDFEEQAVINILGFDTIERVREVISKYERRLGVFLSVSIIFGPISFEVSPIWGRGPVEVKLYQKDAVHSGTYTNLKDFSQKYLLRKQVEIDVYSSCGCSHDDGQLKLCSRSIKNLSPKLALRSNYGRSNSRGDVVFIDPFYRGLKSSPNLPEDMLVELQAIEPRYRYTRGWHFKRTPEDDPIIIDCSVMNDSYAAYTPSYYLNSEVKLKVAPEEFIFALQKLDSDRVSVEDRTDLKLVGNGLKEYMRMTSNARRARPVGDIHFLYPQMTCCLDLMTFHQLLAMVPERVLEKYSRLFTREVIADASHELSPSEILTILRRSTDYILQTGNLRVSEARKFYGVPATKPENWCLILRYQDLWLSTTASVLRYEMYNFLVRMLFWELGSKFVDILDRETPITLMKPDALVLVG